NAPWANKRFTQLTEEQQRRIMRFGFSVESFSGISDEEILEVFCRLNTNGMQLNKQELRNGKFFGVFKQNESPLALKYLPFWRADEALTEQQIARMLEVELTSELLIAGNAGMQDKKNSIDTFYAKWENDYHHAKRDERRFTEVMDTITSALSGDLAESEFR